MSREKISVSFLLGAIIGGFFCKVYFMQKKNEMQKKARYFHIYENWLTLKEIGTGLCEYFKKHGVKEAAIYGYGNIGKNLVLELKNLGIDVKYVVDKRRELVLANNITTYQPFEKLPSVDIIIVTPVLEYENISKALQENFDGKIISLEEIIYECL